MQINEIYQGDSLELLKKLNDNSIDLIITSPPYSKMKKYIDDDGISADFYVEWFLPHIKEYYRVLKPTGNFILNINDKVENRFRHPYVFDLISEIHKQTEFKMFERLFWNKRKSLAHRGRFGDRVEYIFWFAKSKNFCFNIDEMRTEYSEKSIKRMKKPLKKRFARNEQNQNSNEYKDWAPNPKGALPTTLINISSESSRKSDKHVAIFPESLVEYFIKGASNENDIVLDPFVGTGTTAVVSKRNKRNYIGFDIQPEYIKDARKRIDETINPLSF